MAEQGNGSGPQVHTGQATVHARTDLMDEFLLGGNGSEGEELELWWEPAMHWSALKMAGVLWGVGGWIEFSAARRVEKIGEVLQWAGHGVLTAAIGVSERCHTQ